MNDQSHVVKKFYSEGAYLGRWISNIYYWPPNGSVLFCWLLSVVIYNAAGKRTSQLPGMWTVGAPAARHVGGWATDTAQQASRVMSH